MKPRILFIIVIATAMLVGSVLFLILIRSNQSVLDNVNINNSSPQQTQSPYLSINGHTIHLEIAGTPEERTRGLSGRDSMTQDNGMLFIFDSLQKPEFWMYEMKFPLDFVWINGNKVVQINENIQAPSKDGSVAIIDPSADVDKVLEINAGEIRSAQIKVGDEIQFNY